MRSKRSASGFSLLELLVAVGIATVVLAAVFTLLDPAQAALLVQPEGADMQQRLRVGADTLGQDLGMAGAGAYAGARAGPLMFALAPVLPYRRGAAHDDGPGVFRTDAITVLFVPSTAVQTTTSMDMSSTSGILPVNVGGFCPIGRPACGLVTGMTVLVYDGTGDFDTFTVTAVAAASASVALNRPSGAPPATYAAGSTVVQAIQRTYALKIDATGTQYQLVSNDGAHADVPVLDHIVGLTFEYDGDPQPPVLNQAPAVGVPIRSPTTYGPAPPAPGVVTTAYPAGENCAFQLAVPSGTHEPRLSVLGGDPTRTRPIRLDPADLTDGPWCPDAASPNRYDADLLRVRTISVTLRVEAASDALRGPAGSLFRRGGTATRAVGQLPDRAATFAISPPNLNAGR